MLDLEQGYGPVDATERKLVDAIAVAMWKEIRADRFEAEVLTDIPPRSKDRSHGSDLQVPDHAAALTTAIRYQGSAGMAARRAVRAFLEHRKAKQTGLLLPAPWHARTRRMTKNTNELSAAPLGRTLPPSPPPSDPPPPAEPDPDAWLADVPVVEADPSDESLRRSLLGMIEHPILREIATKAPLKSVEQLIVASDNVAYEEWFAKQPKVPFGQVDLPESLKADIEEVTRHNPPWMRGQYLSYYRPPVPAHLFEPGTTPTTRSRAAEPAALAPPPGRDHPVALRAGIARLLDRSAAAAAGGARPRRGDLRRQVAEMAGLSRPDRSRPAAPGAGRAPSSTAPTLNWLGGKEIVRECRAGAAAGRPVAWRARAGLADGRDLGLLGLVEQEAAVVAAGDHVAAHGRAAAAMVGHRTGLERRRRPWSCGARRRWCSTQSPSTKVSLQRVGVGHVLEQAPAQGAVAAAQMADLVHGGDEGRRVGRADLVLDLHHAPAPPRPRPGPPAAAPGRCAGCRSGAVAGMQRQPPVQRHAGQQHARRPADRPPPGWSGAAISPQAQAPTAMPPNTTVW